jgi:hypothetical protein
MRAPLLVAALFVLGCPSPASVAPDAGTPAAKADCDSWQPSEKVAPIGVPGLPEASGLAASRAQPGVLFTHNDSGNDPELFALSTDGAWLGTWTIDGATNTDWEDVAVGPCSAADAAECVFLGDIGDNNAVRPVLHVYVVRAPAMPATPSKAHLPLVRTVAFRYPDGRRDAETLLVDPLGGGVYVVAKRPVPEANQRGVYALRGEPGADGVLTAERIGAVVPEPAGDALITGGSVHPGGHRLLLRTYTTTQEYVVAPEQPFEALFAATPRVLPEGGASEQQGEAITYDATGANIYTTSEGNSPPLDRRGCAP